MQMQPGRAMRIIAANIGHSIFLKGMILACLVVWIASTSMASSALASHELSRITSSDSIVDAVLVERLTGATVATPDEVYIVPKGGVPKGEPLFRCDHAENLSVHWAGQRVLTIQYSKARIFHFMNFWNSAEIKNWTYTVELRLQPINSDSAL